MFRPILLQYFKEYGHVDIYYYRNGRFTSYEDWVEKLYSGHVALVDCFEWARFRGFVERRYGPGMKNRVSEFMTHICDNGMASALMAYPDMRHLLELKLEQTEFL